MVKLRVVFEANLILYYFDYMKIILKLHVKCNNNISCTYTLYINVRKIGMKVKVFSTLKGNMNYIDLFELIQQIKNNNTF